MKNINKHTSPVNFKIFPVMLMSFCLLVLISANFIIYPQQTNYLSAVNAGESDSRELPQLPTEEKSSENTSSSVHEDFIHDNSTFSDFLHNIQVVHKDFTAFDLQIIHFDLISPPPDHNS